MLSIDELNRRYGIKGAIEFEKGMNDFTQAVLTHRSGKLEFCCYGAHITSWNKSGYSEILFMSTKADFTVGKGIRGGIPVIFPQFGGGDLPNHGFVRSREWDFVSAEVQKDGAIKAVLEITNSGDTEKIWPHKFRLTYEIILAEELTTNLIVQNLGNSDFSFTSALHTYFKVGDVSEVTVSGLKGLSYLDKVQNFKEIKEDSEPVSFHTFFDRVYKNSPHRLELSDKKLKRVIYIEKENFKDSILWNPWETAKDLKDLNDYKEMICIESGNASEKVFVKSGDSHFSSQRIGVSSIK